MKTFLELSCIIGAAIVLAVIVTTGCKTDMTANDPFKNPPAPPKYPMLTNNPPAPLAPTGPDRQNNSTLDTNTPPKSPPMGPLP
jgi:hypothetical protein